MSNKLIIIWGSVIILLVGTIYFIGVKYEEELKYISKKNELKEVVKEYIKDNHTKLPIKITTEELEEQEYIEEIKMEDKICAADIKVSKKLIFYDYDIEFTCIKIEE
ncbi:MAG: hypothetical protein HFE04_03485 [Bacilli bacterium]|nr:hypothetical protein [Bacilli bacterium]